MYVGNLNHLVRFLPDYVTVTETGKVPAMRKNGNPLKGESLFVYWQEKIYSGIDIRLPFEGQVFVDQIRLTFPEGSKLSGVSLFSGEKAQLLRKYSPETGHTISRPQIVLEANYETDLLILTLEGDFASVGLENLEITGSYGKIELYPTPVKAEISQVRVPVSRFAGFRSDCPEGSQAAAILGRKLGISLAAQENGPICFCQDPEVAENGFELQITEAEMRIRASDLRGFVYAAETVVKLLCQETLPVCQISDRPSMAFRGVHLFLPAREEIPFYRRLVEHILSPMGYNCIFMQISAGMEFESHPEINAGYVHAIEQMKAGIWPAFPHHQLAGGKFLTKAEVAELVAFAAEFGIDVIPEVQSLGHVQYITLPHPEIAEVAASDQDDAAVDTRQEDERPKFFYQHSYCPSNPDSYRILFDILDEIIEVMKPKKYVHMGHDEVYEIGLCPTCRQKTPATLLAEDINRLHDYLAQKGLTMMMWADMLQPVTKYKTYDAIDRIPKDILMLDFIWYFHMDKDIEDNLLDKGFQVIFGNMYSSHFPRYESRIRKNGVIGAQTSTWVACDAEELGREGKLYEMLFSAQMMWSDSYTADLKYTYDRILKAKIPTLRASLLDCTYPSSQEGADRWIVAEMPAPETTAFAVNRLCRSVEFCHTAAKKRHRIPWVPLEVIGNYQIRYTDGTTVSVPITYGGNIGYRSRRQNEPFEHSYYRHNGYTTAFMVDSDETRTPDGGYHCVYRYEWLNPSPEKPVESITLQRAEHCPDDVIIHKITTL